MLASIWNWHTHPPSWPIVNFSLIEWETMSRRLKEHLRIRESKQGHQIQSSKYQDWLFAITLPKQLSKYSITNDNNLFNGVINGWLKNQWSTRFQRLNNAFEQSTYLQNYTNCSRIDMYPRLTKISYHHKGINMESWLEKMLTKMPENPINSRIGNFAKW